MGSNSESKCVAGSRDLLGTDHGTPYQATPSDTATGGVASTLLDPIETTGQLQIPTSYRGLIGQKDQQELHATWEALFVKSQSGDRSRLSEFEYCRTSSWFVVHDQTREVRVATRTCKLRWCPMCAKARMRHLTGQVTSWFEDVENPKFLTLTLAHSEEPLVDQVKYLYDCFRAFRKRTLLKKTIHGGVWFFQIHKSKTDGLWHPHLHCVLDADYIPHKKLSLLWKAVTLTSSVVDIQRVHDQEKVAEYVARYSARPSILQDLAITERIEIMDALHGKRLVGSWGTARCIKLRPDKQDDHGSWHSVGGWSLIRDLLQESDQARAIVNAWRNDKPLNPDIDLDDIIEHGVTIPMETKCMEREPIQLTFFGAWRKPPKLKELLNAS